MLVENIESGSEFNAKMPRLKKKIGRDAAIDVLAMAHDVLQLEKAVSDICNVLSGALIAFSGPVPLPTKRKRWTVRTSPHIDKDAVQVFESLLYRRLIRISKSRETISTLSGISDISPSVKIEIKMKGELK